MFQSSQRFLKILLCVTLAIPCQGLHAGEAQLPPRPVPAAPIEVTPALVEQASEVRNAGVLLKERLGPEIKTYERTSKGIPGQIFNDIFQAQALIIMLASLSYQASREHDEMVRLNGGAPLPSPTQDGKTVWCDPNDVNLISNALCSGEFQSGFLAGATAVATSAVARVVIGFFLKAANRSSFMAFLGSMISASFMMTGSMAASMLWTQAVKTLPDAKMIQNAHGVAGRALLAFTSGKWNQFQASEDGKLLNAITTQIVTILKVDERNRGRWLYNTWRFGIARGEFVSGVVALMAASAGGELAASLTVLAASAAGVAAVGAGAVVVAWTAPVIGFLVACALGFEALNLLFENSVPQSFTTAFQNLRQLFDGDLNRGRGDLGIHAYSFVVYNYPASFEDNFIGVLDRYILDDVALLQRGRNAWADAGIEKFYELSVEKTILAGKIATAEATVKSADLQRYLYVNLNGEILSYADAKQKLCTGFWIFQDCSRINVQYELEALDKMKPQVEAADHELGNLAQGLVDLYDQDVKFVDDLFRKDAILFPPPIAKVYSDFSVESGVLRDNFKIVFSGFDESLAQRFNVRFNTEKDPQTGRTEKENFKDFANQELSIYYTQGIDEQEIYQSIQKRLGGQ